MNPTIFQRHIVSLATLGRWCSLAFSFGAAAVLVLGFRRLASMELSIYELHMAVMQTLLLGATFVILALLCQFGFSRSQFASQPAAARASLDSQ